MHVQSDLIWIQPPATPDVPSQDKLLTGIVEVECHEDLYIKGVEIRLFGMQVVGYPRVTGEKPSKDKSMMRWEEQTVLDRTLRVQTNGHPSHSVRHSTRPSFFRTKSSENESNTLFLERGIHDFEFHFIIPAWIAPYERCKYGRTRYTLTATAVGAGRHGSNVSATRDVIVVQQQTPDNGPMPMDMLYNDIHEALQYLTVAITTPSLSVAGILTLSLVHPNPPPNLNVLLIRLFVEQKYELHRKDTHEWVSVPKDKYRVWELGVAPPQHPEINNGKYWAQGILTAEGVQPGTRLGAAARHVPDVVQPLNVLTEKGETLHGYRIKAVARLPDDNRLRPSTAKGTRTNIRISHEIGLEILFSRVDVLDDKYGLPKPQVFSMSKSVSIPSCECTFDSIHLPPYSQLSPYTPHTPHTPESSSPTTSRLPTVPRNSSLLGTDTEWNKLIHSLSSLSTHPKRSTIPSRGPDREPSPPLRLGLRTATASRAPSRPGSPSADMSGYKTPVIPVWRPNDATVTSAPGFRLRNTDRSAPRSLPEGSPWAITHMPPRTGESHETCVCGMSLEKLIQAEERLLEGVPTAPGAWVDSSDPNSEPPPWMMSSRPTSPTHDWMMTYSQAGTGSHEATSTKGNE